MSTNPINASIDELLREHGITYAVTYGGQTKRDDWDCDSWSCVFNAPLTPTRTVTESFDYYTGLGHRAPARFEIRGYLRPGTLAHKAREDSRKPVPPAAASVLYCLLLDAGAAGSSFAAWCADYGYDTDSRKMFRTYEACQETGDKLVRLLPMALREKLAELLQDY